ncbi:hypothetical protein LJR289_004935 [Pseudoduganella sp. LjRoot289]
MKNGNARLPALAALSPATFMAAGPAHAATLLRTAAGPPRTTP